MIERNREVDMSKGIFKEEITTLGLLYNYEVNASSRVSQSTIEEFVKEQIKNRSCLNCTNGSCRVQSMKKQMIHIATHGITKN